MSANSEYMDGAVQDDEQRPIPSAPAGLERHLSDITFNGVCFRSTGTAVGIPLHGLQRVAEGAVQQASSLGEALTTAQATGEALEQVRMTSQSAAARGRAPRPTAVISSPSTTSAVSGSSESASRRRSLRTT